MSISSDIEQKLLERTVLEIVIELHPDHLTIPELILKVANDRDRLEGEDVGFAIRDLRASGLLRCRSGDQLVEPTHAALLANELLLSI